MRIELDAADADVIAEALQRLAVDLDAMRRLLGPSRPTPRPEKAVRVARLLRRLGASPSRDQATLPRQ
jgi:hypothetical protein